MNKFLFFIIVFFFISGFIYSETTNDAQAYIIYKQANDQYKFKKFEDARNYYLQLINQYSSSKFVPYSIYMLSFIETDYIKIIDYLSILKEKYPEFQYWTNVVEKLADIFYVMDNQPAAIEEYKLISNDKSFYMLSLIYSAGGFRDLAVENVKKMLALTKDSGLAYKGYLVMIKSYMEEQKYADAQALLQQALKLRKWSYDNGARILYYAGKCYFYRKDIEKHYEKSLYIYSLLKTTFPLSVEASMANNYLEFFKKNNISRVDDVRWITDAFTAPVDIPYQNQTLTVLDRMEQKAEDISSDAEGANGNIIKTDFVEYVVRIGEFKDLSVANLAAADIIKSGLKIPMGVFYRNDMYVTEVRGIKNLDDAKDLAKRMISMGYTETKVLEVVKVVEYAK